MLDGDSRDGRALSEVIRKRVFLYFLLACACYTLSALLDAGRWGVILFLVAGIIAELVFWRHFYLRLTQRSATGHQNLSQNP
jgi:hypothetical protein